MSEYDNNLRGILSKNDRKEKDTHPDMKGQCEIDGVQYWVDGWKKTKKDNSGWFYSLSFKRKDTQQTPAPRQAPARSAPARRPAEDDQW